jgi:glycosyltransferase involved in cell wall biosynthesis
MKVVHISYARIAEQNPERWLEKINFFCGILEEMAKTCEVISLHAIDYNGRLNKNGVHYIFIKRSYSDGLISSKVNEQVIALDPDAVIVHGLGFPWQVLHLQRLLPISVKLFIQNHAERPFRSHKSFLQKMADRNVDGYFFASRDLAKPWIEKRQIANPEKIHEVMEVSSVFAPLERDVAKQKTSVQGEKNYLWVGRLNENKNPLLVIRAFLQFLDSQPEAKLYLIFQQHDMLSDITRLLDAETEKKKQFVLIGTVEHKDMIYWYNSMNFIISTSFYEGSGVAVCEALSCGCFPILTNIPSFRMMTDNGRIGMLYPSNDQNVLVDALGLTAALGTEVRSKMINWFNERLSFRAISATMLASIASINK